MSDTKPDLDAIVVGAGFAGLYMLHRLREQGLKARILESADGVGGTWYWNRYPGARCDILSVDYSYSFDKALQTDWKWSERYARQSEILAYLNHVADRFDLRRDIRFETRVSEAAWDGDAGLWRVATDGGETLTCRWYVMATGCLSVPKENEFEGIEAFEGEVYATGRWPHHEVDFTGKRVAVIGTGSSGIQTIPEVAKQAKSLTVFQRTPNFSIPARHGPIADERISKFIEDPDAYRQEARYSRLGVPGEVSLDQTMTVPEEERRRRYEHVWRRGELQPMFAQFGDTLVDKAANDSMAEFIREKIRSIVKDPETAEKLCPKDHPVASKRPCLDDGYFETFNRPHVHLVDLREDPIRRVAASGIETESGLHEFDVIVLATGFDAMTGAVVRVDIKGRDGLALKDKWAEGPETYMGLTVAGFPNLFLITGPGSPSVLSNMAVSIEQHVEFVDDLIRDMREKGRDVVEASRKAEEVWGRYVNDAGDLTLHVTANSWYMGANVPGKPRRFLPFIGGVDAYRRACDDIKAADWTGFHFRGAEGERRDDGIVRPWRPDVTAVVEAMAEAGLPPLHTLPPPDLRELMKGLGEQSPKGPEVGEIVDGTYPGADGSPLAWRLYRPETPGPHPLVVYFHGGGWVIGDATSDDAFCRDLCLRSGCAIVSCDYRHAPEARFPAAAEDAVAALRWASENAVSLGAAPGALAVAGWSAGGNLAAVAAQHARDHGAPALSGQLLITPVTDADSSRRSYADNAAGPVLTRELMDYFWDHYVDEADRRDPRVSPLRAASLADLPPAMVVVSEFDPLRDEGVAYAEALRSAGVSTRLVVGRGHMHSSFSAVDVVLSGAEVREQMAEALEGFFEPRLEAAE
ncbi:MAG: alpha/beta hydrolase fold domain-containing protein [Paracoccaceae bacterium]